uniref:Uncharacterized protein n=1 Tax=Xiphophorus couchianus TaxID=32473 RepID=A0A3B5M6Z1_9TELE
ELYVEVVGVHLQFLRVQHAQVFVCGLNVVHVLHSFLQTCHDDLSVSRHFGVSKAAKVPLSPGVDNQTPEETKRSLKRIKPQINTFLGKENRFFFTWRELHSQQHHN